jgi:probable rRNA maturation factor
MHEVAAIDLDLAFSADPQLAQLEQPWQRQLAGWLAQLQAELPPALQSATYSLGLSLVDDAEIAALNRDWRQKEGPTDVLAFAAQEDAQFDSLVAAPIGEPLELGDIVISVETAARQAPEHDHSLEQELLFLASHGLLHLLGWDHPDDASLTAMLARQQRLLTSTGPLD